MNAAWKRLKGDKAVWDQGTSRAEMEKDLVLHVLRLSRELGRGKYRPAPVRMFPVLKGNGKKRIISALTLRDKLAQRAVLEVITPMGEALFHHDSFGYRPGRSIDGAMARVREQVTCGYSWLVDADIRSFFDTIPHGPLMKQVKRAIPDRDLVALIKAWLETGAPRTGILAQRRGIPQGGVISPFLCNLYLTEFDLFLTRKNLPFVRFADDFLVFTPNRKAAEAAMAGVKKGLDRLGLELHNQKTRIVKSGPGVIFLGRKLPGGYRQNPSSKTRKR
ncbi:MAG: Retron-type reverse transcriptase [Desulfobacteraceae bacterium]|nr:Retron-type reverse transcriptase [Desulfobacteraceae bacterium]